MTRRRSLGQSARRPSLTRRAMLRGAGGVAIALPLLPELLPRARAELEGAIPQRLFTMTFGLGMSAAMQAERFDGPLEPISPFADKAALFTNVDNEPLSGGGARRTTAWRLRCSPGSRSRAGPHTWPAAPAWSR
ncbi:MAG: hypothetical protein AAGF11_17810 [Myxococcota bacterium]